MHGFHPVNQQQTMQETLNAVGHKKLGGGGGGGLYEIFCSATLYSSSRSGYRAMYNPIQDNPAPRPISDQNQYQANTCTSGSADTHAAGFHLGI